MPLRSAVKGRLIYSSSIFCFFGTGRKQNASTVGPKGDIGIVPYSASLELAENRMPLRSAVKGALK